jgi:hypothetical protein
MSEKQKAALGRGVDNLNVNGRHRSRASGRAP